MVDKERRERLVNLKKKMEEKLNSDLKEKPTITLHPMQKSYTPVHKRKKVKRRKNEINKENFIGITDLNDPNSEIKIDKGWREQEGEEDIDCKFSPKINKRSSKIKRNFDDLISWERDKHQRSVKRRLNRDIDECSFSPKIEEKSLKIFNSRKKRYRTPEERLLAYGRAKELKRSKRELMSNTGFFMPKINSKSKEIMENKEKKDKLLVKKNNGKTENLDFFKIEPNFEKNDFFTLKTNLIKKRRQRYEKLSLSGIIRRKEGGNIEIEEEENTKEKKRYISPYSREKTLGEYEKLNMRKRKGKKEERDEVPLKKVSRRGLRKLFRVARAKSCNRG